MKNIIRETAKDGVTVFRKSHTDLPEHFGLTKESLSDYTGTFLEGFVALFDLMDDEDQSAYGQLLKALVRDTQQAFEHVESWLSETVGDVAFHRSEIYCWKIDAVSFSPIKKEVAG